MSDFPQNLFAVNRLISEEVRSQFPPSDWLAYFPNGTAYFSNDSEEALRLLELIRGLSTVREITIRASPAWAPYPNWTVSISHNCGDGIRGTSYGESAMLALAICHAVLRFYGIQLPE